MGGGMIAAAVFGVLMILLAGYLIIYNIFRISILKDIWLYGQLKTIGTSPKQLKYMVKRQGYLLALAGIPAGLILGWLLGNVLLPLIMASTTVGESVFIMPHRCVGGVGSLYLSYRVDQLRPPRKAGSQSISCGSAAISGR